ncbi:MAG: cupin domain-containing protein [Armatimonadota bacterium]|nr:cupin domain-containing protein [Armatimonadota bacterium]MDR7450850.1 cupin domain-containing protein [Armatimonadota bacterium]MDR7465771.1 cupin domain-containing protein [Armatimonadota bacterium]MDR7493679.1 cupin domain-containing protein [Armatimonadota bacterium]MDR7499072.1 cupin domain-containing protein [Armatimonadota bacterium]
MRGSMKDLPVILDVPEGKIWQVEWGGNIVEFGKFNQPVDPAPFFKGLPDDRCQCPHWGYVLKGRLRYRFKDHEEIYEAGDAYYAPPGHTPVLEAGVEYVELSPMKELAKTMEVVKRNMQMMNQV